MGRSCYVDSAWAEFVTVYQSASPYDFFRADLASGDFAFPALIAAHLRRAASASLGLMAIERPGGLPQRLAEPCSASIARDRRSRSAINSATIWSIRDVIADRDPILGFRRGSTSFMATALSAGRS